MSEDAFEEVPGIKYHPEITARPEEEILRELRAGKEFMALEILVVGIIDKIMGIDALTIEYVSGRSKKSLTSRWMQEKIRLLTPVCEKTVMKINRRMTTRIFLSVREQDEQMICLYRLSAWLSMGKDGLLKWKIKDHINPAFVQLDKSVAERATEARRRAGEVMAEQVG